jgi:hypothetical protein
MKFEAQNPNPTPYFLPILRSMNATVRPTPKLQPSITPNRGRTNLCTAELFANLRVLRAKPLSECLSTTKAPTPRGVPRMYPVYATQLRLLLQHYTLHPATQSSTKPQTPDPKPQSSLAEYKYTNILVYRICRRTCSTCSYTHVHSIHTFYMYTRTCCSEISS